MREMSPERNKRTGEGRGEEGMNVGEGVKEGCVRGNRGNSGSEGYVRNEVGMLRGCVCESYLRGDGQHGLGRAREVIVGGQIASSITRDQG